MTGRGATPAGGPAQDGDGPGRAELAPELPGALARGDLRLHFQPVVGFAGSAVVGFEALVRWEHPRSGLLGPDRILAAARAAGLVAELDTWVLNAACRAAAGWAAEVRGAAPPAVAVNASLRHLDERFLAAVDRAVDGLGLDPGLLCVDLHERDVADARARDVAVLGELVGRGVRCSVDDFGVHLSTPDALAGLPVHAVKLDRTLVARLGEGRDDEAYARSIVREAHARGLTVTAEGIETPRQLSEVRSLGCDDGQGFYFARPQPAEVVRALVHHPFRWRERHPAA